MEDARVKHCLNPNRYTCFCGHKRLAPLAVPWPSRTSTPCLIRIDLHIREPAESFALWRSDSGPAFKVIAPS